MIRHTFVFWNICNHHGEKANGACIISLLFTVMVKLECQAGSASAANDIFGGKHQPNNLDRRMFFLTLLDWDKTAPNSIFCYKKH